MTARRPTFISPMLATLVKPPEHYRTSRPGDWQYERKLDGLRCVAVRNGDRVDLFSRNELSFNARFPEVAAALAALPGDQTSFSLLHSSPHPAHLTYGLFDMLHVDGHDTTRLALTERQALL